MLQFVVLLNLIFHVDRLATVSFNDDPNEHMSLKNDPNLDLSVDEEYEDLRAELLAYNTALSSLNEKSRSEFEPLIIILRSLFYARWGWHSTYFSSTLLYQPSSLY